MLAIVIFLGSFVGACFLLGIIFYLIEGSSEAAERAGLIFGFLTGIGLWFWFGLYGTVVALRARHSEKEITKLMAWAEKKGYNSRNRTLHNNNLHKE